MTTQAQKKLSILSLCLILCLPLWGGRATHAEPGGEIIYKHPWDPFEIWIGNTREGRTTYSLFKPPLNFMDLAVQKGDRYLLTVAENFAGDNPDFSIDAYLLDRQKPHAEAKNLTNRRFGDILNADISNKGNIVFTCHTSKIAPGGLYLIPNHERENPTPKAERLVQVEASAADWAPNGTTIAYCTKDGIFGYDLITQKNVKYTPLGCFPVFSPDGRYIAYIHRGDRKKAKIGLFSLSSWRTIETIELENGLGLNGIHYLTWSDDGQYIVYTIIEHSTSYLNFAISLDGFHTTRILKQYGGGVPILEWTNVAYAVEPVKKLTTLWGSLKAPEHTHR